MNRRGWLAALAVGFSVLAASAAAAAGTVIDHIMLGAPDLASGGRQVAELTGVTPAFGGVHPGRGTANALMSLGSRTYLEVIAPAPGQPPANDFAKDLAALPGLDIRTFAVAVPDLDALAAAARKAGLTPVGPTPGARETADGTVLRWRTLDIEGHSFEGLVPFFIDWGDTPHPAATSPAGATFQGLRVVHPRAAELRTVYQALGLDIPVSEGARPLILLDIVGKTGPVTLTGDAGGHQGFGVKRGK